MNIGINLSYSAYVCSCLKTYTQFNVGYRKEYFFGTKMHCALCSMKFTRKIALIVWTKLFGLMKPYTECPRRNVPDFGRVFLMLKFTDITQNTSVQSWTVTEIMSKEKCGLLADPHTVPASW